MSRGRRVKIQLGKTGRILRTAMLSSLFSVLSTHATHALEFAFRYGSLEAVGEIQRGDATAFVDFVFDNDLLSPDIENRWISLDSLGGSITEAMLLGEYIRDLGFSTIVKEADTCVSACFLAFIGGRQRVVGGRLGTHQFEVVTELEDEQEAVSASQHIVAAVIRHLARMDIDPAVLAPGFLTPADEMHYFTDDELFYYNIYYVVPN